MTRARPALHTTVWATAAAAVYTTTGARAEAPPPDDSPTADSHGTAAPGGSAHQGDSPSFAAGLKGGFLQGWAHGETVSHGGGGAFVELLAVPHWLELELGARVMTSSHGESIPIDLLAKKPFHLSRVVHPFVGLGPTLVVAFPHAEGDEEAHTETFFGLATALGSYFWLGESVGALAELNYNLVSEHGAVHELGGNVGTAVRW